MSVATLPKEQTAFRFEPSLIKTMKIRARSLNISLNKYVTDLVEKDLKESATLPKIESAERLSDIVRQYAGIMALPSDEDLNADERLKRIWER